MTADVESGEVVDPLTDDEFADRERLETIITSGFGSFIEVGLALAEVKARTLYRDRHATFVDYLEATWQVSESRAYQLVNAATIVLEVSTIVEDAPDGSPLRTTPLPQNEAQARELTRFIGKPELAAEVLREAEKEGAPTASAIKAAAEVIAPRPKRTVTKTTTTTTETVETVVETEPVAAADPAPPPKLKAPAERNTVGKQVAERIHTAAVNLTQYRVEQADERTVKQLEAWCRRWRETQ